MSHHKRRVQVVEQRDATDDATVDVQLDWDGLLQLVASNWGVIMLIVIAVIGIIVSFRGFLEVLVWR